MNRKFTHQHALFRATAPLLALVIGGCAVYQVAPPPRRILVQAAPLPVYAPPVVRVDIVPLFEQPAPVLVGWAPPPMLVEVPAVMSYPDAVWVGGYWVWQGNWVWATGRWQSPPYVDYRWVHPYYENRDGAVIFIAGHWSAPGVLFVPPPSGLRLTLAVSLPGVVPGPRPIGPPGIFVPPPPGSRFGLIVPAPQGTPPSVVSGAAPVVNVGMRISNTVVNSGNTTNINNVNNVNNITQVTRVTIVAPASATASGRAYEAAVPTQMHQAAALPASAPPAAARAAAPRSPPPQAQAQAQHPARPEAALPPPGPAAAHDEAQARADAEHKAKAHQKKQREAEERAERAERAEHGERKAP